MWKGWFSFILGVMLILSALISGLQIPITMILLGTAIALTGMFLLKGWEGQINSLIGLWLFVCGFIPGFTTTQHFLVLGVVVSIISLIKIFHLHRGTEIKHNTV